MQSEPRDRIALVRLKGIGKSFGGIRVLSGVDLDVGQGEIHGLVGENGAGKSTLGKIIGGYYSASEGTLEVFGSRISTWSPKEALDRGIAIMHQELQLVPELTVAQNVFLGIESHKWGVLSNTEEERMPCIVKATGFELDPSEKVANLSIADRQKIEIMRALAREAKVIVMDEPTSSLSAEETDRLHATMLKLRDSGGTVVYVSHFLDNILEVCDRITVLRDGRLVRTADGRKETKSSLVSAMLGGGQTETPFPAKARAPDGPAVLEVDNLSAQNGTRNASFKVNRGEIVGFIGLVGSGRTEIARAVIGADQAADGSVRVNGARYDSRSPSASTRLGLVMAPEDRRRQGLVMTMPVRANFTLPHLRSFADRLGRVRRNREVGEAREVIEHFQIKPSDTEGNVFNFSGGNQQKVLLGKWLLRDPQIVILDEPSRGVDVGARQRIHEAIAEVAANGAGVLLISSEIDEVLGLAHRAYLVSDGCIAGEIDPEGRTEGEMLELLFDLQRSNGPQLGSAGVQ